MNRKSLFFTLSFVLSLQSCFAQYKDELKNSYSSDTLQMVGYTYVSDTLRSRVHLRNINNQKYKGPICCMDTGEILEGDMFGTDGPAFIQIPLELQRRMAKIVDDAFTIEDAVSLDGKYLMVKLYISALTGEITDVYFNFHKRTGYSQIPIEVFRNIELQLKEQIVFNLTEDGRRLNYCYLAWTQCPTGYVAPTLDPDMPFDGSGNGGNGNVYTGPRGSIATEPMRIEK